MDDRLAPLQTLTHEECIQILRGHRSYGRIGYVVDGRAVILPVNFAVDGDSLVFVTTEGTKQRWLAKHSRVSFEVDGGDPDEHTGWSVLVQGIAGEVTDTQELEALRRGPLVSWAVSPSAHWIRISLDHVSGRRLASGRVDVTTRS
jgi:uncharacterized protein